MSQSSTATLDLFEVATFRPNVGIPKVGHEIGRSAMSNPFVGVDGILKDAPGVANWVSLGGFSLIDGTNASNTATIFIVMQPWDQRTTSALSQKSILGYLQARLFGIQDAILTLKDSSV